MPLNTPAGEGIFIALSLMIKLARTVYLDIQDYSHSEPLALTRGGALIMWDMKQDVPPASLIAGLAVRSVMSSRSCSTESCIIAFVGKGVEFNGTITY